MADAEYIIAIKIDKLDIDISSACSRIATLF